MQQKCLARVEVEFDACDRFFHRSFEQKKGACLTTRLDLGQFHLPGRKDHEIFAGSILYTDREAKQYNNLLHFQRIKSHVVSAMVQDYCQKEGSCSRLDASVDLKSTGLSRMEEIEKDLSVKVNPWSYIQQVRQTLQEIGCYCSLFIILYMSIRNLKLTVSLIRAMILERLSFREASGKYLRPDRQIYQSLAALHQALDMEGVEMSCLDQNTRQLERSERVSLLPTPEERTQQILRRFQESFETESGSYDGV